MRLLETSVHVLDQAGIRETGAKICYAFENKVDLNLPVPVYKLLCEVDLISLWDIFGVLDHVMPGQERAAVEVGKTYVLSLVETGFELFERIGPVDPRLRQALATGRMLFENPDDERIQERAAIDGAWALYMEREKARKTWTRDRINASEYRLVGSIARLAMCAAAPLRPHGMAYDPTHLYFKRLRKAILNAIPKPKLEGPFDYDSRGYYADETVRHSIGSLTWDATSAFRELLEHLPGTRLGRKDIDSYAREVLLFALGVRSMPQLLRGADGVSS